MLSIRFSTQAARGSDVDPTRVISCSKSLLELGNMSDWSSDSDDERRISNQTWNKLQKTHLTTGFREGALFGEDKQFQAGFDEGFQVGFQKSYDLAEKHGKERILRFMSTKDQGLDIVENLRVTVKALCNSHSPRK